MKRMMAAVLMVGMVLTGFAGVAQAAETEAAGIGQRPESQALSEETRAKLQTSRELARANRAVHGQIRSAVAVIREILDQEDPEAKGLFEQARRLRDELIAQKDSVRAAREGVRSAIEARDEVALNTALDRLIPLQKERLELQTDLLKVLEQLIKVLEK